MMERPKSSHPLLPERIDFFEELAHRVAAAPLRSAERTRARFMALAASQLVRNGHRKLRVRSLNKSAGTSQGTFYRHFKDGQDVAAAVWSAFMQHRQSVLGPLLSSRDLFSATLSTVTVVTEHYRSNASLYRAFMPLVDADRRFASIWDAGNMSLVNLLVDDMISADIAKNVPRPLLEAAIVMAYSILDENLYAIFAAKRARRLAAIFTDVASFTEVAAVLIHRALFGEVSDVTRLGFARPLLHLRHAEKRFAVRVSAELKSQRLKKAGASKSASGTKSPALRRVGRAAVQ